MTTPMLGMIERRAVRALAMSFAIAAMATSTVAAQDAQTTATPYQRLAPNQLDSLVAPVALYADPLLAQVMLAATYPNQVDAAAAWVRANGTGGVDTQSWDVSVKAVAHYPGVLNMLDSDLAWTAELGAAYANQSTDLMDAVQHMRALAQSRGNLVSTPQQDVITDDGDIAIVPAQPAVIYVPVYDPYAVYYESCLDVFCSPFVGFSIGYPIGPWFIYDWDWPRHRIFYTGWVGGGWIARSRPFVRLTGVYVNERNRAVPFNRGALPLSGESRGAFSRAEVAGVAQGEPRASGRPAPVQRGLITRVPPPASGAQSAFQAAQRAAPRSTNQGSRAVPPGARSSYTVPRQVAPRQTAPRQVAPQGAQSQGAQQPAPQRAGAPRPAAPASRPAPPAAHGGSSSAGRTAASRGGRGG